MGKQKSKTISKTGIQLEVRWRPKRFPVKWVENLDGVFQLERTAKYPDENVDIPFFSPFPITSEAGLSRQGLPAGRDTPEEITKKLAAWYSRPLLYRDVIASLTKPFAKHDWESFKAAVSGIVERHAQMKPQQGDTVEEWKIFLIHIQFLHRFEVRLAEENDEHSIDNFHVFFEEIIWEIVYEVVKPNASYVSKPRRCHAYEPTKHCTGPFQAQKYAAYIDLVDTLVEGPLCIWHNFYDRKHMGFSHIRSHMATLLRRSMDGAPLKYNENGVWLECGAREWAMLELAERFTSRGLRRCDICHVVLEATPQREYIRSDKAKLQKGPYRKSGKVPTNKETCDSSACKRALSRRRAAERIPKCIPEPKDRQESQEV